MGTSSCNKATMPHGLTTLLFVLLAGLLVAVARGQSDYYDQYLDTQDEGSDVDKRAWNSGFNSGMGKRAWNSGFNSGMGKRKWNSGFSGGMGKRFALEATEGVSQEVRRQKHQRLR